MQKEPIAGTLNKFQTKKKTFAQITQSNHNTRPDNWIVIMTDNQRAKRQKYVLNRTKTHLHFISMQYLHRKQNFVVTESQQQLICW